jgi:hypothetical protein
MNFLKAIFIINFVKNIEINQTSHFFKYFFGFINYLNYFEYRKQHAYMLQTETVIRAGLPCCPAALPCPVLPCPVLPCRAKVVFFSLSCCPAGRPGQGTGQGNMFCPGKLCTNFQSQMFFSVKLFDLVYN